MERGDNQVQAAHEPRNQSLADSEGVLSWTREHVGKPLVNAALIELRNAISSSINDLSNLLGGGKLINDCERYQLAPAQRFSREWTAQSVSTGVGTVVPYLGAVGGTKLGFKYIAGQSTNPIAAVMRHQTTAMVVGGSGYDFLRQPHEGETRLGNAAGSAVAMLTFEGGNHLSRNLSMIDKSVVRAVTGGIAGQLHVATSELVTNGALADSEKLQRAGVTGAAVNVLLPGMLDRISAKANTTVSKTIDDVALGGPSLERTVRLSQRPQVMIVPDVHAPNFTITADDAMRALAAKNGLALSGKLALSELPTLPTAARLTDDAVLDFHMQVARSLKKFRSSEEFVNAYEKFAELRVARKTQLGYADEVIQKLNAKRSIVDQYSREHLTDNQFRVDTMAQRTDLRTPIEQFEASTAEVARLSKEFSSRDVRIVTRDLEAALNSLGEGLGVPRLGLRFKRMPATDYAWYGEGVGVEAVNARQVMTGKTSDLSALMAHEASHAYQDTIVLRQLADNLHLGSRVDAIGIKRLQAECDRVGHTVPTERWAKAVMAVRDGKPLAPDQIEHATRLLAGLREVGKRSNSQELLQSVDKYLSNPNVDTPVRTFLGEIENPSIRDAIFTSGELPDAVTRLQRRLAAGENVDTWLHRANLRDALKSIRQDHEVQRYLRYRNAFHEQDAWNVEERVRALISRRSNASGS